MLFEGKVFSYFPGSMNSLSMSRQEPFDVKTSKPIDALLLFARLLHRSALSLYHESQRQASEALSLESRRSTSC
ncbi:MAG TPA: hypothetical protein PLG17_06175, partial [Thermodesulfobacteriota bacterium]|nr:hypothetical protein [Thermodesulfobacteriota bacterium]